MSKPKFYLLCFFVLAVSLIITLIFGCNDKISLFISCLGAFSTIATLYVAYIIFISYSSPADIQKKRFELVDKSLAFFITKRFLGIIENGPTYFLYLTKQRLDNLLTGVAEAKQIDNPVIVSLDFLEFLSEFQSQLENHYFPFNLKMIILSNLPQGATILPPEDFKDKVKVTIKYDAEKYGYINNGDKQVTINEFIGRMNIIRVSMINFLNDKVPHKYRIVDENI